MIFINNMINNQTEDEKFVVDYTKFSETNIYRWIEIMLLKEYHSIKVFRSELTDKEDDLELISINQILPHLGDLKMKLINKIPESETNILQMIKIGFYGLFIPPFSFETKSIILYKDLDYYYNDVIPQLSKELNKNIMEYHEDVNFLTNTPLDPHLILIQGPLIQILEYDDVEKMYVIDFMYLKDYEYRTNLKKIPFKAYYLPNNMKTLDLVKFEYLASTPGGHYKIKKITKGFTMNIFRHINSAMCAKKTIVHNLLITRMEVCQNFAYCVKKYLSKSNLLKIYLLHFIDQTLRTNSMYCKYLLAESGPMIAGFPFTRDSFNTLCGKTADSFSTDPLKYRKILNPLSDSTYHQLKKDGVMTLQQDDAVNIFKLIEKNVSLFLEMMDNKHTDEIKEFESELRKNCRLYLESDTLKDILTMCIYCGSVQHEIAEKLTTNYYQNPHYIPSCIIDNSVQEIAETSYGVSENGYYNMMKILFISNIKGKLLMDIEYITNCIVKQTLCQLVNDLMNYEKVIKKQKINLAFRLTPSRLETGI